MHPRTRTDRIDPPHVFYCTFREPVGGILGFENRWVFNNKTKPFFSLNKSIIGESHQSKIKKIINFIKSNKADYLFVSAPENVAWLLNIRGHDNPNSPIPNCQLIIGKNKKFFLITNKENAQKIIKEKKIRLNQLIDSNNFKHLINSCRLD